MESKPEEEMAELDEVPELSCEEQESNLQHLMGQFVERVAYCRKSGMSFIDFSNGKRIVIGEMYWMLTEEGENPSLPN